MTVIICNFYCILTSNLGGGGGHSGKGGSGHSAGYPGGIFYGSVKSITNTIFCSENDLV